ncbi:MAG TPA: DUF4388 domain-containing protein [Trebonia sp.]
MVAAYDELVRPRVLTAVEDLVAREASGVLDVTGNPSGAIYLDGGRIAFAAASWVPGLAARLRAVAPALPGLASPPSGREADDAAVAAYAVQHGYLTQARLHELIQSIVVDAFLVLTIPLAADSPVAAIRFTSTRTYWTEMFPRLELDRVRAEAFRRAERMAEHGLSPTTAVALRDLRAPTAVLTRDQWAVACQIGEHASALDLAARRGAALCDTVDALGSLTQAGLCGPVRISGRGRQLARGPRPVPPTLPAQYQPASPPPALPPPAPALSVQPPPAPVPSAEVTFRPRLPFRQPGQDVPPRPERPVTQAPTMDILRQVLTGLRRL